MCIDFTNLNKACPKYSYPLPSIDQLVDNLLGFGVLSFKDAFFRFDQLEMHLNDEDRITFITNEGVYCYKVMSFIVKKCRSHIPKNDEEGVY